MNFLPISLYSSNSGKLLTEVGVFFRFNGVSLLMFSVGRNSEKLVPHSWHLTYTVIA